MNYDDAVRRVLDEKGVAFTFLPEVRAGNVVGGKIYTIAYNPDYETDPEDQFELNIGYVGGSFFSSEGEEEFYHQDDLPAEAKSSIYQMTNADALDSDSMELQMFLEDLRNLAYE